MALKTTVALALLCAFTTAGAGSLLEGRNKPDALLPVDQAFELLGAKRKGQEIVIDWGIAPGYYLYGHTLKVTADGPAKTAFAGPKLPKGELVKDAEFGNVEIYRDDLQARLTLVDKSQPPRTLRVRYQGCADIGVCYPPQTRIVAVK